MGDGRDIPDSGNLHTHILKGTNCGLAPAPVAGDNHIEFADPVFSSSAGCFFRCHLGGIGRRFARTLEADRPTGGPHDGVTSNICDVDDGVIEAGRDVRLPVADVLAFATANPLLLLFCQLQPLLRDLFLAGDRHPATLTCPGVCVSALPPYRKPPTMTHTLIGPDLDFALDVLRYVATEVTFDLKVLLEEPANPNDLIIGEITNLRSPVYLEVVAHLMGPGRSDPVKVGKSDFESLLPRKIDA